jgi:hypothetical protein
MYLDSLDTSILQYILKVNFFLYIWLEVGSIKHELLKSYIHYSLNPPPCIKKSCINNHTENNSTF